MNDCTYWRCPPPTGARPPQEAPLTTSPRGCPKGAVSQQGARAGKYWKGGEGRGGGVWVPKTCVPEKAQNIFHVVKFRFFLQWSLWSGGGGPRGGVPSLLVRCTPGPPLHGNGLCPTVSSHPRGNIPQGTVPSPPPPPAITKQRTRDTKQNMQTRGHMSYKMSQELPIWDACLALLRNKPRVPLFLAGLFCMKQGTVQCLGCKKSEVHSNAPILPPPCPASKRTGEAQYPTF